MEQGATWAPWQQRSQTNHFSLVGATTPLAQNLLFQLGWGGQSVYTSPFPVPETSSGGTRFFVGSENPPPIPGSLLPGASLVCSLLELQMESLHKPYITQSPMLAVSYFSISFFFKLNEHILCKPFYLGEGCSPVIHQSNN